MLQQTQVKTVIPYFKNFVKEIPTLRALSKANGKKVLKLWEGLGYYRRAKNLQKTAKILVKKHNSKIPNTYEEIKKLPGIGEYTANILLALVYNQPRIGIDGNVKRVFSRLLNQNIDKVEPILKKRIVRLIPNSKGAAIAEALMEFGAIICKPKNPKCNICNIKNKCNFFKNKNFFSSSKKILKKEKKYNIYCYLKKNKKQIALTKNKNLSFLNNFNIPETQVTRTNQHKKNGWIYLCSYKNNISNIKMNINLFYKFTEGKPLNFQWHSIEKEGKDFIPSFTKKIFKKVSRVYL